MSDDIPYGSFDRQFQSESICDFCGTVGRCPVMFATFTGQFLACTRCALRDPQVLFASLGPDGKPRD